MRKTWLGVLLLAPLVWCVNLDSLYQLAQPGEGYDRLLVLDSFQVYEGGINPEPGKKGCIHGRGAIVDLGMGSIHRMEATGSGTVLDIDRCVIINGASGYAALDYNSSASGQLNHLTVVKNYDGIRFWRGESLSLKNTIIINNNHYGVATVDSSQSVLTIAYNDMWHNQQGGYMCWITSC